MMKSPQRIIISLFAALVLLSTSCARITPEAHRQACRHYQQGLELYRLGEAESAVWELEQAIRLDPRLAPAHDLLGQIYLRRGDIRGRWLATKRALRAVALAPHEVGYRYNLAMICRERGFGHNAKRELEKVLELDPEFWKALYQIGLLHEESALKYESEKKHLQAAAALRQAVKIVPREYELLLHLGLNLGEVGRWGEAAEHLRTAAEVELDRHEAYLLLAVTWHRLGELERAEESYQAALERMTEEQRVPFESLEYLASSQELEALPGVDRGDFLRRFWKDRDPTPTTPVNERRLEHYRRVAHANVHFAATKLDLPGWKTKRGEFYIRYGEPTVKWRKLGEISSGVGLIPPRWVWCYGEEGQEVTLVFADSFLNGEYNFPFPNKTWGAGNLRNSPATIAQRMVESTPQSYRHDYGGEILEFFCRTVEFRGSEGKTDLEIVYGIPNQHLQFSRCGQMARAVVQRRAALFDLDWNEVVSSVEEQSFKVPPTKVSNPNLLAVEKAEFLVTPGDYWLALNIRDQESKKVGIVKMQVEVGRYDHQTLAISSLILANWQYSDEGAERFRRGDVVVIPRLGRHFQISQPLSIYYEIYNLTVDFWSRTWYQTEYTIARRGERKSLVSRALSAVTWPFRAGRKWESVSSTLESRGTSAMEIGNLQVDMSGAAPGQYELILTVTDMNGGQRAEREVGFVLVE